MTRRDEQDRQIPRTMSTQHPDNATVPEWSSDPVIDGDNEIYEAYYAYQSLNCQEVMWDSEGKDVDTHVVRKLLSSYWNYFSENILGTDLHLTYRIPNPTIEPVEKKVLVETLQNIPVAFDVASTVYKKDITPIFEVILPFTTSGNELIWLFNYYRRAIVADEDAPLDEHVKARDWIGSFKPKTINVIPLVEDEDSILNIDQILKPYIAAAKPRHLRVFIARSDPALNYGLIAAVLLSKMGLAKLKRTSDETGVAVYPIIGVGSKPFRGHLSPENLGNFLKEYSGLATVTVQSADRYDYPMEQVKGFVKCLNSSLPNGSPVEVDAAEEKVLRDVLRRCRRNYESVVEVFAPFVNSISAYVPQRRARKLHIGLFGYSRNVAGVSLPRAITFAAALYSIGIPPEFIGSKVLEDLTDREAGFVAKYYVNLRHDFSAVGGYVSWENVNMLMELHLKTAKRASMNVDNLRLALTKILADLNTVEDKLDVKLGPRTSTQRKHENFTNNFLISYLEHEDDEARVALVEAAKLRKCLG